MAEYSITTRSKMLAVLRQVREKLVHEAGSRDPNLRQLVGHANLMQELALSIGAAESKRETPFGQHLLQIIQGECDDEEEGEGEDMDYDEKEDEREDKDYDEEEDEREDIDSDSSSDASESDSEDELFDDRVGHEADAELHVFEVLEGVQTYDGALPPPPHHLGEEGENSGIGRQYHGIGEGNLISELPPLECTKSRHGRSLSQSEPQLAIAESPPAAQEGCLGASCAPRKVEARPWASATELYTPDDGFRVPPKNPARFPPSILMY